MRNHDRLIGEIEEVDVNMPIVLMFVQWEIEEVDVNMPIVLMLVQCPIFIEIMDFLKMLLY